MKNMIKIAVMGAVLALGLVQSNAQTNPPTTQIVYNVNITLTGFGQSGAGTVSPVKLSTKAFLTALGGGSNGTFSAKAKLIAISSGGGPVFAVRDGTNETILDSSVLSLATVSDSVTRTLPKGGTEYEIIHLTGSAGGISFDVQGAASLQKGTLGKGTLVITDATKSVSATVSGTGNLPDKTGTPLYSIVKGTVGATSGKVEALP